jgi:hypothetical protein
VGTGSVDLEIDLFFTFEYMKSAFALLLNLHLCYYLICCFALTLPFPSFILSMAGYDMECPRCCIM